MTEAYFIAKYNYSDSIYNNLKKFRLIRRSALKILKFKKNKKDYEI